MSSSNEMLSDSYKQWEEPRFVSTLCPAVTYAEPLGLSFGDNMGIVEAKIKKLSFGLGCNSPEYCTLQKSSSVS